MISGELPPMKRGIAPLELVGRGTDKLACYACAKCGRVYHIQNAQLAELCCAPKICGTDGCEEVPPTHRIYCEEHEAKLRSDKEAEKFEKAEKIPYEEWSGGHLYSDRMDRYYPDWESYLDDFYGGEYAPEPYLWDCTRMEMSIDAESVIEDALSDHHEYAYDYVDDFEGLQKLLDGWCAKQSVETFYPTSNRAVIAPVENDE